MLRGASWLRLPARRHLKAINADHLPANGALIVATNCERLDQWMHTVAVLDRFTRFVPDVSPTRDDALLAIAARRLGISLEYDASDDLDRKRLIVRAMATLRRGDLVAVHMYHGGAEDEGAALFNELQAAGQTGILPVYCGEYPAQSPDEIPIAGRMSVVVGKLLPAESSVEEVREALARLGR